MHKKIKNSKLARRVFSVGLSYEYGVPQTSQMLGIPKSTLYSWRRKFVRPML